METVVWLPLGKASKGPLSHSYLRPDMDNFGDVQRHCDRIFPAATWPKLFWSARQQVKQAKEVFAWFDRDQDGYWNRKEAAGRP